MIGLPYFWAPFHSPSPTVMCPLKWWHTLTVLFPLYSCRQKIRFPKADVVQPGPQTFHTEMLAPLLSLQLWKGPHVISQPVLHRDDGVRPPPGPFPQVSSKSSKFTQRKHFRLFWCTLSYLHIITSRIFICYLVYFRSIWFFGGKLLKKLIKYEIKIHTWLVEKCQTRLSKWLFSWVWLEFVWVESLIPKSFWIAMGPRPTQACDPFSFVNIKSGISLL